MSRIVPSHPPYIHQTSYDRQPPYAHQPQYGRQPPYEHQPQYDRQPPYGHQPQYDRQPPYGHQPQYDRQPPYGHQPQYDQQLPYEHQPQYDRQPPYGHQPQYDQQPSYGHQPSHDHRQPYAHQPQDDHQPPHNHKQSYDRQRAIDRQPVYDDQQVEDPQHKNPSLQVPSELSLLASLSALSLEQEASFTQAITGLSAAQRFRIFDQQGRFIMSAVENQDDTAHRICCGAGRAFVFHICDQQNRELLRISREFKCCAGCCWCAGSDGCALEALVQSPSLGTIGRIRQKCSFFRKQYSILDAKGKEHLHVISPFCICQGVFCCCCENKFTLYDSKHNKEIGGIFKEYAGVVNQALTGAEKYTIKFPDKMSVQLKAISLGALFLINLTHFGGTASSKGGTSVLNLLT